MESIGSAFLIVILLAGIITLFKKRVIGLTLMSIAVIFLYVIPNSRLTKFKEGSLGNYRSSTNRLLIIYKDETYALYENNTQIDSSYLEYIYVDDGVINFYGKIPIEIGNNGELINKNNRAEIYFKVN